METWKQLSEGSLWAAEISFREGEYRSSVSRAYYAAYCAATEAIVKKLITFPNSWNNPPHIKVPVCVQNVLTIMPTTKRRTISRINISRSYRKNADYRLRAAVNEKVASKWTRHSERLKYGG